MVAAMISFVIVLVNVLIIGQSTVGAISVAGNRAPNLHS